MKFKIVAFLLPAACGAALAITLSVAAAEQPPARFAAPTATSSTEYSEYRNVDWHFSLDVPTNLSAQSSDNEGGVTIQFIAPQGNDQFQVSAWPYSDLDVALGEEGTPATASDQPSTLGIVHVFHDEMFEITFVKNGISYVVQSLPGNATSTLDILKSWKFI